MTSSFSQDIIARVKSASVKQWSIFALMLLNTIFTYVGNAALPKNNSEISHLYTVILTPPGGAFSIWAIIFITEWIFTVWQLLYCPEWSQSKANLFGFSLWCVAQSAWAVCFPFELIWLCFCFIFLAWFGLLIVEIEGMNRVRQILSSSSSSQNNTNKTSNNNNNSYPSSESCSCLNSFIPKHIRYFLVAVAPQSIHLGWITAATGLNLVIGVAKDNDTLAPQVAACIFVCCLIAVTAWTRCVAGGNVAVAFALIWALVWIQHRKTDHPIRLGSNSTAMFTPAPIEDGFTIVAEILASLIGSLTFAGFCCRAMCGRFIGGFFIVDDENNDKAVETSSNNNNKKFVTSSAGDEKKEVDASLPVTSVVTQANNNNVLETKLVMSRHTDDQI